MKTPWGWASNRKHGTRSGGVLGGSGGGPALGRLKALERVRGFWAPKNLGAGRVQGGVGGGQGRHQNSGAFFAFFVGLERVTPRADTIFGRGSLQFGFRVFLSDGAPIPVAGWPSESWPWARPCTWRHSQALGAVFAAPPIVHPVKVCLGPGTLVKGGYGLSRPGGNLGFRI